MICEIVRYAAEHEPVVLELNQRLAAGGSARRLYEQAVPSWVPRSNNDADTVWRENFVAYNAETHSVHGGYCLKPQLFRLQGFDVWLATWQGPVSEGIVDTAYSFVGLQCIRDMQDRYPLLFGWGNSPRLVDLLVNLGWRTVQTPLLIRVCRPRRFLREFAYIRGLGRTRLLADAARLSGAGSLGLHSLQLATKLLSGPARRVSYAEVDRFGDWADDVWAATRDRYDLIAHRDAESLNRLMAGPGWPNAVLLRVGPEAAPVGWAAVRVANMRGDRRFGDMRVGSVLDALAYPGHEAQAIGAARHWLERRGVDMIAANFTHDTWVKAFQKSGFLLLRNKRVMTFSPDLVEILGEPDERTPQRFHLTPIDADGPIGL